MTTIYDFAALTNRGVEKSFAVRKRGTLVSEVPLF